MGFRPEPTVYKLTFAGTALDGLHVSVGCCSVREYNQMLTVGSSVAVGEDPNQEELLKSIQDTVAQNEWILDLFVRYLKSWDLEDAEGKPVPTTREGLDSQERYVVTMLIQAWQTALVTVPNLSSAVSSNGATSAEQSLGLGTSSESLPS